MVECRGFVMVPVRLREMARGEITLVFPRFFHIPLDVFIESWLMCGETSDIPSNHGDMPMTTNQSKVAEHEQVLREAFRAMKPDSAQEIRESFYKAVEGLKRLADALEMADMEVGDRNDHALIEEHLIACAALEEMNKSVLGRIL